jgi:formate-dependent nitrite reductase cytochrome c552 subunit
LTKLQHPETETFWGSKHERAGIECKDCHMPKVKDKKGKSFTFHGQRSARYMLKDTCVRCHSYWSQEAAEYQVDAIQNYVRGKMRKVIWPGERSRPIPAQKTLAKDELKEVALPRQGLICGVVDCRNSDGFHNPELARSPDAVG